MAGIGAFLSSVKVTATGLVRNEDTRVRGVYIRTPVGGGTVDFLDGGSGGTNRLSLDLPAAVGWISPYFEGEGIRFRTNLYVSVPAGASVTIFYD